MSHTKKLVESVELLGQGKTQTNPCDKTARYNRVAGPLLPPSDTDGKFLNFHCTVIKKSVCVKLYKVQLEDWDCQQK